MRKLKAGHTEKHKKVNKMSLRELKEKIEKLKRLNDNSAYLKNLEDAVARTSSK